jgi:hypothetical protein
MNSQFPEEKLSAEQEAVRRLVSGLERVAAPPDFDFRLRARLAQLRAASPANKRWWFQRLAPAGVALAGLLAAAVWLNNARPNEAAQSVAVSAASGNRLAAAIAPPANVGSLPTPAPEKRETIVGSAPAVSDKNAALRQARPNAALRNVTDQSVGASSIYGAGRFAISLRSPSPRVRVEFENERAGKRAVVIDTLTFGREGLAKSAAAPETVIW